VFILYSQADAVFVNALGSKLDQAGIRYWRDVKDAIAGRPGTVIERAISLNPRLLLVLSKHAVQSDWVQDELDKAWQLSEQLGRDVLFPVALDRAWLEDDRTSEDLRAQIKKYQVLDFSAYSDDTTFATQFRNLIDGLGLH
jgi:hypothetical protein